VRLGEDFSWKDSRRKVKGREEKRSVREVVLALKPPTTRGEREKTTEGCEQCGRVGRMSEKQIR
jgi:hypothetical protein